ncbi:MAG TPA: type VI secretion system Vgr family protein, partial [Duganella sp.]
MADLKNFGSLTQALVEQQNRLVKLTTPLGEDVLLPQRVVASDRLGRGYEYTIDCLSVIQDIELKKLIARPVTLWVQQPDKSYLPVHGYVHTMKRLGSDGQFAICQMIFAPWLHFLKFRKDARIWQDKAADDILSDVFNVHPQAQGNFRFDVREPAIPRSYCTQYETDWHFVQRLMEEEGWYSYHEQQADGSGHVLVVTDATDELKPIVQKQIHFHAGSTDDELNKITHWSADRSLAPSQLTIRTSDYKAPNLSKQSNTVVRTEHGDLPRQLEIYEYTGAYTYSKQEQGDKYTRLKVEQWESSMKRYSAVSGVRSLPVGSWFTLEDHRVHQSEAPEDRQFIVIAVEWCIENNLPLSNKLKNFPGSLLPQLNAAKAAMGQKVTLDHAALGIVAGNENIGHCFNRMEVQRRKVPFRSPFEHAKPTLHPQTAVVVGPADEEVYTDHLNRVKVQFRWDRQNPGDESASCWVRVSYPNAGQGWGGVNVPRIRQEVIVTFLDGDADRPVITGRLYNEDQAPHWHTDGRLSGYKSKEYKGSGFNQLLLDDTTTQNRVHLYSTSAHTQLSLGYLVSQQGNKRGGFYGSGFSLSTDDFGAIVTHKGLYLSTFGRPGPQGT